MHIPALKIFVFPASCLIDGVLSRPVKVIQAFIHTQNIKLYIASNAQAALEVRGSGCVYTGE